MEELKELVSLTKVLLWMVGICTILIMLTLLKVIHAINDIRTKEEVGITVESDIARQQSLK